MSGNRFVETSYPPVI